MRITKTHTFSMNPQTISMLKTAAKSKRRTQTSIVTEALEDFYAKNCQGLFTGEAGPVTYVQGGITK